MALLWQMMLAVLVCFYATATLHTAKFICGQENLLANLYNDCHSYESHFDVQASCVLPTICSHKGDRCGRKLGIFAYTNWPLLSHCLNLQFYSRLSVSSFHSDSKWPDNNREGKEYSGKSLHLSEADIWYKDLPKYTFKLPPPSMAQVETTTSLLLLPIFAGQGSLHFQAAQTDKHSLRLAEFLSGRILLAACHSALHSELNLLSNDELQELDLCPSDSLDKQTLIVPLNARYIINPPICGPTLLLIQILRYLIFIDI